MASKRKKRALSKASNRANTNPLGQGRDKALPPRDKRKIIMDTTTTTNMISSNGYVKIRISPNEFLNRGVNHFHILSLIKKALPEEIIIQHGLNSAPGRLKTMDIESVALVASNYGDYDPEIELNIGWIAESPA